MVAISLEELIRRIITASQINPYFRNLDCNCVGISIEHKRLQHIWLHTTDDLQRQHRLAYECNSMCDDNYHLNHYIWVDGKGWKLVGEMKSNSLKNYTPNFF